jgi:hypothetical protein
LVPSEFFVDPLASRHRHRSPTAGELEGGIGRRDRIRIPTSGDLNQTYSATSATASMPDAGSTHVRRDRGGVAASFPADRPATVSSDPINS